jgi:fructuronate reductase
VHQAIADPALRTGATGIMSEAAETLTGEVRESAEAYSEALITRFANPELQHRLRQIAMDGSQKVPIRLVKTWVERRNAREKSPHIEAAIGAWLAFLWVEISAGHTLQDPMAEELAGLCRQGSKSADVAQEILTKIGAPAELGSSAQVRRAFDASKP